MYKWPLKELSREGEVQGESRGTEKTFLLLRTSGEIHYRFKVTISYYF